MIQPAFEILNQRGTPMFFSDVLANRPTFGIVGRIFIATDSPYGLFRDTGTAWVQIAGSGGGGGITGSGAAGQVTFWSGASAVSGSNNLWWDNATNKFLVGTNNATGGGAAQITNTTGDDHLRVWGSTSPSIRIDNAVSAATQRFAIGLATATNNFIQGSAAGNICITTASANPLLFGMWQTTNATEVMRISTANNLIIGTTTDTGQKLQVVSDALINGLTIGKGFSSISSNTAIGISTLSVATSGVRNTAVGNLAGSSCNSNDNTIIGSNAGISALTGGQNTFIGSFAGEKTTSGARNIFIGHVTGRNNTSGSNNTQIGTNTGQSGNGSYNVLIGDTCSEGHTTASNNTHIGSLSMSKNSTGNNNVALGYAAGSLVSGGTNNTISNNSIYIGYDTRANASNQTNQIVIGYNETGLGSNTTIIGNSSTITTAIRGNLLLGTTTDAGFKLDVQGTARVSGNLSITSIINGSIPSSSTTFCFNVLNNSGQVLFRVRDNASLVTFIDGNAQFTTGTTINSVSHAAFILGISAVYGSTGGGNGGQYFASVDNSGNLARYMVGHATKGLKVELTPTNTWETSALLQVTSNSQGFLKPRMTNAQILAITSPAAGLEAYNTDLNTPCFYDGTGWRKVSHSAM